MKDNNKSIRSVCVEKLYGNIYPHMNPDVSVDFASAKEPLLVENDGLMQAFRFSDIDVLDAKDRNPDNTTSWIFFGERLSLKDVYKKSKKKKSGVTGVLVDNMICLDCDYVCHTQTGAFVPMDEGDLTFDEYLKLMEKGYDFDKAPIEAKRQVVKSISDAKEQTGLVSKIIDKAINNKLNKEIKRIKRK